MPLEFTRTVFIDRSFGGIRLPGLLRKIGLDVRVHKECDWFNSDEDDAVWIPDIAARGWVILSSDRRIARDPINVNAVLESKAQVVLASNNHHFPEFFGAAFIVGRDRVRELLEQNPGPVFIQISHCHGDHVRLVKKHLTHPNPNPPPSKPVKSAAAFPHIKF